MTRTPDGAGWRRRLGSAACATAAFFLLSGAAAAQDIVTLAGGQAAIVFMVTGQGITGDIEIRDAKTGAPVWDALLSQTSVRQFTVRPGDYRIVAAPGAAPVAVVARPGRAILVALAGENGGYRIIRTSDVGAGEIGGTALPSFIDDNRIPALDYAPVSLDRSGAGLSFLFRADF